MLFGFEEGKLDRLPPQKLDFELWNVLSEKIAQENNLFPLSPKILEKRHSLGQTGLVVCGEKIISHLTCLPLLENSNIKANDKTITSLTQLRDDLKVYSFYTGWTDPSFRRKGLSLFLRKKFSDKQNSGKTIFIGLSSEKKTWPVLAKLNFVRLETTKFPYLCGIVCAKSKYLPERKKKLWWESCFWASNKERAELLEKEVGRVAQKTALEWTELLNVEESWQSAFV